ncbi:MAG: GLPGLI family protein, partial [Flavobacteriaceae bacterium]|nr:GLPGLI family protein [Flavobacteriaceae bacterium]
IYNENEMKFYFNKVSPFKNDDTEITMLIADIQGIYYRKNNFNDLFVGITKYGNQENFIIKKKIITDWKISEDKKMICGYECYKASCLLKVDYGDNEINTLYPLTAWYCPQLKYSYGPKGFGGLPGTILELEQNLIIYTAVNINTEKASEKIAMPTDTKIITEAKMYDLFEESTNK